MYCGHSSFVPSNSSTRDTTPVHQLARKPYIYSRLLLSTGLFVMGVKLLSCWIITARKASGRGSARATCISSFDLWTRAIHAYRLVQLSLHIDTNHNSYALRMTWESRQTLTNNFTDHKLQVVYDSLPFTQTLQLSDTLYIMSQCPISIIIINTVTHCIVYNILLTFIHVRL